MRDETVISIAFFGLGFLINLFLITSILIYSEVSCKKKHNAFNCKMIFVPVGNIKQITPESESKL